MASSPTTLLPGGPDLVVPDAQVVPAGPCTLGASAAGAGADRPRGLDMPADDKRLRAAQFVRMSTEHQQHSTANQMAAIADHAVRVGLDVVRTYSDDGKSGLSIRWGQGLRQLLADVVTGARGFSVGATACYGLRRMLTDASGRRRGELERGEHKFCHTDRVVFVPGTAHERAVVDLDGALGAHRRIGSTGHALTWSSIQLAVVGVRPRRALQHDDQQAFTASANMAAPDKSATAQRPRSLSLGLLRFGGRPSQAGLPLGFLRFSRGLTRPIIDVLAAGSR